MPTGKIVVRCPEMSILATFNPFVREAQEILCDGDLTLPDGTVQKFQIVFPKCKVRFKGIGQWLVDKVTAMWPVAKEAVYPHVSVTLAPERVVRTSCTAMEAQPVDADGTVTLLDGTVGQVKMTYPKCVATWKGLGKYVAESVVAEGTVEFP